MPVVALFFDPNLVIAACFVHMEMFIAHPNKDKLRMKIELICPLTNLKGIR